MSSVLQLQQSCTKCSSSFPATKTYFYVNKTGINGLHSWCKKCVNKQSSKRRTAMSPAQRLAEDRKHNAAYKLTPGAFELYLVTHARIRNEKYYPETVFDLTVEWVQQQFAAQEGRCFWLKVPMRLRHHGGSWQVSLDRLSLDIGYTKDNVVLTSKSANMGRMATEVGDFELFLEDVRTSMRII